MNGAQMYWEARAGVVETPARGLKFCRRPVSRILF